MKDNRLEIVQKRERRLGREIVGVWIVGLVLVLLLVGWGM